MGIVTMTGLTGAHLHVTFTTLFECLNGHQWRINELVMNRMG